MATDNSTILAKAWLEGTNDFQQRIPNPTQAGIAATIDAIFDPLNGNLYNQFMSVLINRIGMSIVHAKEWENPLAVFKSGKLNYGSTIQEIFPKWTVAHSYSDSAETLLKMNRPDAQQWFHKMDRQDRYDLSITRDELRQAFTDEYGLNNLVAGLLTSVTNSAHYDEYIIMKQLIAEYETRWGFFKHQLSAAPTTEATGKAFLSAVRKYVGKLRFPSTLYNASNFTDIPVFAKPEELILMVTPELAANLSVEVLADMFHVELADINVRQIIIDEFPIPNAQALLTTQDWFVVKDVVNEMQSWFNPQTLTNQYWYHIWQVVSCSPFVPAILFTTATGTVVNTIEMEPTAITLTASSATAKAGSSNVVLTTALSASFDPSTQTSIVAKPDSVTYELSVNNSKVLNSRTYVEPIEDNASGNAQAILHIQKTGLAANDVITVKATSTYVDPTGEAEDLDPVTTTITITA